MSDPLFAVGGTVITFGEILLVLAVLLALVLLALFVLAARRAARRRGQGSELEAQVAELIRAQTEMNGRIGTMAEVLGSRQSDLLRGMSERLDGLGQRIGQSMTDTTRSTAESLAQLQARIAVIDQAQQKIATLSSEVVQLQKILDNKQSRGAFGEGRMQAIVQDGLPKGSYAFQSTLSNGKRPDCVIRFPNGAAALVVDAKFPLEAWSALRAAATPEAQRAAEAQFRRDTLNHIQDISARYLIPGETQELAFMFVPSESVFADIHERFEDLVQRAHRAHVVIVSPSLLMLAIQVMQSVLRDAQMREQAHLIRDEVVKMMEDVRRLDERVRKLKGHFGQVTADVDLILTSTGKILDHSEKIRDVKLNPVEAEAARRATLPAQLPFREIEEV